MGRRKKSLKNELSSNFNNMAAGFGGLFQVAKVVSNKIDLFGKRRRQHEERLAYLRNKYSNEDVVQKLIRGQYWKGQPAEQLRDSLGPPIAVDNMLLKTLRREVWKYNQHGKNRYHLRITVEDDRVVGWDQKN